MANFRILFCLVSILPLISAGRREKAYGEFRRNLCKPQKTPMYGGKWCDFKTHQAEIGSVCHFSCMKGFHLRGSRVTRCEINQALGAPRYNATVGFCEPNAPILREGKNGPYLVHSYDPAAYVIHVDSGKEVTLKSYYYLAIYVQTPGLNRVKNTVSFLIEGREGRYIKTNGTHVFTDNLALDTGIEKDRATFYLRSDQFFDGYAAFESYIKEDYYMLHKSRQINLAKIENHEDSVLASFIWTSDL